jgi:hypothetical protein
MEVGYKILMRKPKEYSVGIGAIIWSIWLNRNDIVFNKKPILSYMHVMSMVSYWTRTSASFQKEEGQMTF